MSSKDLDLYRQEFGHFRETMQEYLAKNEDYLLNDPTGLKLSRSLLDQFVTGWVGMAQRSIGYDVNYYAMSWFMEMMMGPAVTTVTAAVLAGIYDFPPNALRELFEGIELAYALDTKPDMKGLTMGRKFRILEGCAKPDSRERKPLIEYTAKSFDQPTKGMMSKFYHELSDFAHAPGYVARGFKSGRLSDHFPPSFREIMEKPAMKDYVPERWLIPTFELRRLQEDDATVDQMILLLETFSSLAKLIFDKWESIVAGRGQSG
ncbi:MAG: hypothetical protein JRN06_06585 [Nitrososphaerota archaeon]|nr:hypothetical protein [Nitrososphaerota archaeon]